MVVALSEPVGAPAGQSELGVNRVLLTFTILKIRTTLDCLTHAREYVTAICYAAQALHYELGESSHLSVLLQSQSTNPANKSSSSHNIINLLLTIKTISF